MLSSEQVDTLLQMADTFDRMKTMVTQHDERIGEYQSIIGQVQIIVMSQYKYAANQQAVVDFH